jgi:hypothetical protein
VKKAYVILAFLSLAILGQIAFNISYNVSDLIVFFVPVYVLVGLFIGLVFSANQDIIPKTISLLLVIHLFSTNISSGNILLKNTYWLNHFKPLVALYHQQKDSLPLYYPLYGFDYYTHQYVNYLNLSGSLGEQKTLIDSLSIIRRLDSFYVESSFPNLADAYNFELVASESITSFVQQYSKPHNAIFFSIRGEGADNLSKEFISVLKAYGSNIESLSPGGSYAAVLYDGRMIESIDGAGVAVIKSDSTDNDPLKGELSYKVYSAGSRSGDSSAIEIKGYNYSVNRRGMNIVVYDKQNADVTDMVSFDIITKEEKRLFKAIKKEYYASKAPKPPIGKTIALKGFNDLYVGRENGGPTLVCNKETVDAWEKFEVVDAGGGKIALRSGGKFVSSENGNGPMNCSRSSIGDWEKFDWIVNSDSTVTLKGSSWFNASVENEKGSIMCNTSTIGNKEKFTLQIIP